MDADFGFDIYYGSTKMHDSLLAHHPKCFRLSDLFFELLGFITPGLVLAGTLMISPLFGTIRQYEEEI